MSKLITTFIVRACVCALAVLPLTREAHAVIYGRDNRQFKADAPKDVQAIFGRTFIMGPPVALADEANIAKRYFTSAPTEKGFKPVCADEVGHGLPVPEWSCSGGIIGKDRVLTAGHCFEPSEGKNGDIGTQGMFYRDSSLENVKGKQLVAKRASMLPIKRWEIVQQWMSKPKEGEPEAQDYSIATIEGEVAAEHIFPIAKESPKDNETMALIGHPAGLPSMYRDFKVFHRSEKYLMVQNSSTYHGDSGSLQFDEKGHVRAVFIQGMPDFFNDMKDGKGCARSYVCPETPVLVSMRNQEKRKGLSAEERRCLYEKAQRIEEPSRDNALVTTLQAKEIARARWESAKVLPVKDLEKTDIELNIADEGAIGKVVVIVRYHHTFAGDWAFKLTHGDRTVQLAKANGEDNRKGYVTSVFSTEELGRMPIAGRYTLNIADEAEKDMGKIYGVSIHVIPAVRNDNKKGTRHKSGLERKIDDLLPGHYVPEADPDIIVPAPVRKKVNPWIVAPCGGDALAHCAQPNLKLDQISPHLGYPVDAFDGNAKVYLALARGQQASDLEVTLPNKITTATGEVIPVKFENVQLLEPIPYAPEPGALVPDTYRMLVIYRYHGKNQLALADFDVKIVSDGSSEFQFEIQNHDSTGQRKSAVSGSMNVSTGFSSVASVK